MQLDNKQIYFWYFKIFFNDLMIILKENTIIKCVLNSKYIKLQIKYFLKFGRNKLLDQK